MVRGIERCRIFRSNKDREDLLNRLADIVVSSGTSVYAWSLLENHAHFLLRTGKVGLSRTMRRLLTGYAVSFNRRHKRVGHLFQNRFKSIIVEEGSYLLELVRYIHLNPLRVGLVRDVGELDEYRWTGHGALLGEVERAWQDVDYVLEQFGVSLSEARRAYREFVAEGVSEGSRPDLVGGGLIRSIGGRENLAELRRGREKWAFDERVLGSSRFVVQLWEEERRASVEDPRKEKKQLDRLLRVAAKRLRVSRQEVVSGSRRRVASRCRQVVSWVSVSELGIPAVSVAKLLGVTVPSVLQAIEKGRDLVEEADWDVGDLLESLQ